MSEVIYICIHHIYICIIHTHTYIYILRAQKTSHKGDDSCGPKHLVRPTKHPRSPNWHRRVRRTRAHTRNKLRSGLQVAVRRRLALAYHHSVAPDYCNKLLQMVKGDKKWQYGKDNEGRDSKPWRLWRGPWQQDAPRWGWESHHEQAMFPAYDRTPLPSRQRGEAVHSSKQEEARDPEALLVRTLQDNLNAARKAEQKVRSLIATRNQKTEMWKAWLDKMRKSYLQELDRHEKDIARLDGELEAALAHQEAARLKLRNVALAEHAPKEETTEPDGWQQLRAAWEQEKAQSEDSAAVLQRALQAVGVDPNLLRMATRRTPPTSPRPYVAPTGGELGVPFRSSPGNLGRTESRTPTRARTPQGPRAPVKPYQVAPPVKTAGPQDHLRDKLEKARETMKAAANSAMHPFGVPRPGSASGPEGSGAENKPSGLVEVIEEGEMRDDGHPTEGLNNLG